ncbi:MAG: VWA domain-containing protein [Deltaproteobacteria bacterium]|nr:VWA domain-containing protein [Deltaproteobacteria bacterium]
MKASNATVLFAAAVLFLPAAAGAGSVKVGVELSHPVMTAGAKQTTYLKVSLQGLSVERGPARLPANIAIVLDRSGSMSGEKLRRAKEAAITAIEMLGPKDIISVVAYDDQVRVLVPATRVSDREQVYSAIRSLNAGNTTALFAGVSRGAAEVRKFLSANQVNRVILLSDGIANVGPSSPEALGALGASLIKEGISVTTIGLGLGYNEDLMQTLARRSDGNHAFVENAADLARIFGYEFGDILSVVARDVEVKIACPAGVRPIRVLGRDADIVGQVVTTRLNQIYGKQEKFVLVEVEVPPTAAGRSLPLASVSVQYNDPFSKAQERNDTSITGRFSGSAGEVEKGLNRDVMVSVVQLVANERNKEAVTLRDQGKLHEARRALEANIDYLNENAARYKADSLKKQGKTNKDDADNLEGAKWQKQRKNMVREQYMFDAQQSW